MVKLLIMVLYFFFKIFTSGICVYLISFIIILIFKQVIVFILI